MSQVLHFTVDELASEVRDLLRKVGCLFSPGRAREIVLEMERDVAHEREEKARKAAKRGDFAYRLRPEDFPGYPCTARTLKEDCPMCAAGLPKKPAPLQLAAETQTVEPCTLSVRSGISLVPGGDRIRHHSNYSVVMIKHTKGSQVIKSEASLDPFLAKACGVTVAENDQRPPHLRGLVPGDTTLVLAKTLRNGYEPYPRRLPDIDVDAKVDACECGVHKTTAAPKGNPTHSSWCPWSKP